MGCPAGQTTTRTGVCVEIRGKSISTDLNWTGASNRNPTLNKFAMWGRTTTTRNRTNSNRSQRRQKAVGGKMRGNSRRTNLRGKRSKMFAKGGRTRPAPRGRGRKMPGGGTTCGGMNQPPCPGGGGYRGGGRTRPAPRGRAMARGGRPAPRGRSGRARKGMRR